MSGCVGCLLGPCDGDGVPRSSGATMRVRLPVLRIETDRPLPLLIADIASSLLLGLSSRSEESPGIVVVDLLVVTFGKRQTMLVNYNLGSNLTI